MSLYPPLLKQELLNQIFRGAAAPSITGPFVISLHTGDPGANRANEISTGVWTNYARQTVARSTGGWSAAANAGGDLEQTENGALIDFGFATIVGGDGANNRITHVEVWDSAGSPRRIWGKALSDLKVINNADPVTFPIGTIEPGLNG